MSNGQHIAYVEDDASVRAATARFLRSCGFVVTTFHSAEAFLQSNEIEDTCCLITDVRLPGMSGFQLKIELERNGFDVPTIFVTAYPGELIPASAQGVRPACVLTKPVREMELLARIDEVRDRPPE